MNTLLRHIIIMFLLSLIGCSGQPSGAYSSEVVQITQNQYPTLWEKLFFKEINERIKATEFINLRDVNLPPDSKEIRIWIGFDLSPMRGIILKQNNEGEAEGYYIPPKEKFSSAKSNYVPLSNPKSGWDNLWKKLESLEIETLPDSSKIGIENDGSTDSRAVVIEIKTSNSYRVYYYSNLTGKKQARIKQFQQVLQICNALSDEFGVQLYYWYE